jgi:hypothetical protein
MCVILKVFCLLGEALRNQKQTNQPNKFVKEFDYSKYKLKQKQ